MDRPEEFAGIVTIRWAPALTKGSTVPGWHCAVILDGEVMPYVTAFDVHADTHGPVWAEVTLLIDDRGHPVKSGGQFCLGWDGQPLTSTYDYLVAGMEFGVNRAELERLKRKGEPR